MVVVGSSPSSMFFSPLSSSSSPRRHLHLPPLQFRRRRRLCSAFNASNSSQETGVLLKRRRTSDLIDFIEEFEEEESDDEEEDRSLDLFVRFLESVFRKVSRRARKAVRSVLPVAIPAKLVHFAVNGALALTLMWILKAFLQVICTLGSIIFVSILLIRFIWSGVTYFQDNRDFHLNRVGSDNRAWARAQPAS